MVRNTQFVAEFTTNHLGNFNLLLEMVRAAADAGADWIKMQKKDVETFYSKDKLSAPFKSPYGESYYDYRKIFEFDEDQFREFSIACDDYGIKWFSTVQDIKSLEFMLDFDLPMYKISSSMARDVEFIKAFTSNVSATKTVVMSVAGLHPDEIEERLRHLLKFKEVYVLHCVAEYPTDPKHQKLGNITALRALFEDDRVKIGYSGHEEGYFPSLAAIGLGAKMVERHFCLSRHSFAHHIECALKPDEFKQMIKESHKLDVAYWDMLPAEAFDQDFGMTPMEKDFLLEQKYGKKYLKDGSEF